MPRDRFAHVRVWVFDLDNTLYPPQARLFDLIDERMTAYVMQALGLGSEEAGQLRRRYWQRYGTTLAGLMDHHGLDPWPFLEAVHDIPLDRLTPDPGLAACIGALPGRRIVHTNGSAPYARRVLSARGLAGLFDAVYGIEDAGFHPKPRHEAFAAVIARDGLDPACAAMFEDDARNLAVPHALGMRTVHVAPRPEPLAHVDHHTDDLAAFLGRLMP